MIFMKHPSGTEFHHIGTTLQMLLDWRMWLWCHRNGYRFRIGK